MMDSYDLGQMMVSLVPITILWIVGVGWPVSKVLRKAGFSGWWTVIAFIPLVNIIGLWVFAIRPWPSISSMPLRRS